MSEEQPVVKPDGTFDKKPGGLALLWFRGKAWNVPMLDPAKDFPEAEAFLRSKRRDPLKAIKGQLEGQPDYIVRELLDRAYRDMKKGDEERELPRHEVSDWLDTQEGFFWTMHKAMIREYPKLTLEEVKEMFLKVSLAEGLKIRDEMLNLEA